MSQGTTSWVDVLLGGRYQVAAELGRGGMAVVYRARDRKLGCDVVLKVPSLDKLAFKEDRERFVKRFAREIRSLVQLTHSHIVKISDVGAHEGVPFAVMQYLSGGKPARFGSGVAVRSWLRRNSGIGCRKWQRALDFIHRRASFTVT